MSLGREALSLAAVAEHFEERICVCLCWLTVQVVAMLSAAVLAAGRTAVVDGRQAAVVETGDGWPYWRS